MTANLRVLLAAGEAAGVRALRALAASGHELVAVLAAPPVPGLRGAEVAEVAATLGVPVWPAARVREPELAEDVRRAGVDLLLNVYSLYLIHPEVLAALGIGGFNLHPGPLPEYAGLNVVSWALYRGETGHAVTLHWLEPRVDAGPIAFQRRFPVGEEDTAVTVGGRCIREGLPLLSALLEMAAADPAGIPRLPQDHSRRRYFRSGPPHQGWIAWAESAVSVVGLVRACDYAPFPSPWGRARAAWHGRTLEVLKARRTGEGADRPPGTVGGTEGSGVRVAAGDEWVRVERIALDGSEADARDVLRPGERLAAPPSMSAAKGMPGDA